MKSFVWGGKNEYFEWVVARDVTYLRQRPLEEPVRLGAANEGRIGGADSIFEPSANEEVSVRITRRNCERLAS